MKKKKFEFSDVCNIKLKFSRGTVTLNDIQNNFTELRDDYGVSVEKLYSMSFTQRKKHLYELSLWG